MDEQAPRCPSHAAVAAVGSCRRCGTAICHLCRARWFDQALCVTCVEKALAANEPRPDQARARRRQALLSLSLAVCGWLVLLLGMLPVLLHGLRPGSASSYTEVAILVSLVPALFAVGVGLSALRFRSERVRTATAGLVVAAAQLGILLGFFMLSLWHA